MRRRDLPEGYFLLPFYDIRRSRGHLHLYPSVKPDQTIIFKEDWVRLPDYGERERSALFAVEVIDSSMEPMLSDGDTLVVDPGQGAKIDRIDDRRFAPLSNRILCLVAIEGRVAPRFVQVAMGQGKSTTAAQVPTRVILTTADASKEPIVVPIDAAMDVHVIGRVVWAAHKFV